MEEKKIWFRKGFNEGFRKGYLESLREIKSGITKIIKESKGVKNK